MKSKRDNILSVFNQELQSGNKLIGFAVGAGISARLAEEAGIDLILVLSSGKLRMMGRNSLGGFLPFFNSNNFMFNLYATEIAPVVEKLPVVLGLTATDPELDLSTHLKRVQEAGVSGIINFPSVGFFEGNFRQALEENNFCYAQEVEMLKLAHLMGFLTIAFVFNAEEAQQMLDAGVDILGFHLGLTLGGKVGAKKAYSLVAAKDKAREVFRLCQTQRPEVIRLIAGGGIVSPVDLQFIYQNSLADGFIGGSTFERLPMEREVIKTLHSFKDTTAISFSRKSSIIDANGKRHNPVATVKDYVSVHYSQNISFNELCKLTYTSRTRLSNLFTSTVGVSFRQYLMEYRMNIAAELLRDTDLQMKEIAELVSYYDYPQFSKIFKKIFGLNPSEYRNKMKS